MALVLAPGVAVGGMWEEVAGVGRGGDEKGLRTSLAATPGDFEARRSLAEILSATKRTREAAREFELAVALAPTPADEARMLFRLANERTRLGAYDESLDAYEREIALGDTEPAALANSAELLMARGDLIAAIDRYREAVAIEERAPNRREHLQGMALGYFGLAVALDRQGAALASREAMGRALALDPGLTVLRVAGPSDSVDGAAAADGDVFFVPRGEVFYYLGLARETQGRAADASVSFRDYLRVATGRYAVQAREHLARLMGKTTPDTSRDRSPAATDRRSAGEVNPDGSGRPTGVGRVLHHATVRADGPLVAPLIDAAWRLYPRLLDACLLELPAPAASGAEPGSSPRQWKVSLEMRIEDSGRVGAVAAKAPPELGEELPRCIEAAVLQQFRVSRPARKKPTLVRMELVLAPAPAGGV